MKTAGNQGFLTPPHTLKGGHWQGVSAVTRRKPGVPNTSNTSNTFIGGYEVFMGAYAQGGAPTHGKGPDLNAKRCEVLGNPRKPWGFALTPLTPWTPAPGFLRFLGTQGVRGRAQPPFALGIKWS